MLGRALSLATVMLAVGCFPVERALAQENLDAGKTPSQIFAGTCNACHKSPRGLLKTVPPSSLPSFLRQHYTTSPNMAGVLANYLVSNGATDTRLPKEGSKQEAKQDARPAAAADQGDRSGRKQRPTTASQEPRPESTAKPDEGELPAQAAIDHGGKSAPKQKLGKRGREEPPKADAAPAGETAAKEEPRPDSAKPSGEVPSQSAKVEPSGDAAVTRPDPVPLVTPAPAATAPMAAPPVNPPALSPAAVSAAVAGTTTEVPAVPLPSQPAPAPPPAVAAAAPPLPPVAPAGPPAPPISQ